MQPQRPSPAPPLTTTQRPPPPPPHHHPKRAVTPVPPPPPPRPLSTQDSARGGAGTTTDGEGVPAHDDEPRHRPSPTGIDENVPDTPQQPPDPMLTPMTSRRATPLEESTPAACGHNSHNNHNMFETPTSSSSQGRRTTPATMPPSSHKHFVFLSDEKIVPDGLKRLHESNRHRRRHLMTQIHNLDCHLASLTATFAEETMDMDLALRDTLDRSVCIPLEASVDRLMMERESSHPRGPAIVQLERHLATIDTQMTQHSYVNVNNATREYLDSLHNELLHDVVPRRRMEDSKSDKMEGGVIRRYENIAGIVARQFHQEAAARRASVEVVRQHYASVTADETQRDDDLLKEIRGLRERLKKEREQRRRQDMMIMDDIRRTTVAMKRALLAVVGGT